MHCVIIELSMAIVASAAMSLSSVCIFCALEGGTTVKPHKQNQDWVCALDWKTVNTLRQYSTWERSANMCEHTQSHTHRSLFHCQLSVKCNYLDAGSSFTIRAKMLLITWDMHMRWLHKIHFWGSSCFRMYFYRTYILGIIIQTESFKKYIFNFI